MMPFFSYFTFRLQPDIEFDRRFFMPAYRGPRTDKVTIQTENRKQTGKRYVAERYKSRQLFN